MQHTLNKICIIKNTPLKMTFVLFIYIYTHMYKINTFFSSPNYLLAINRTQQLSEIRETKKEKLLETGQLQFRLGERAVQREGKEDKGVLYHYSLLQLSDFWKRERMNLRKQITLPTPNLGSQTFGTFEISEILQMMVHIDSRKKKFYSQKIILKWSPCGWNQRC